MHRSADLTARWRHGNSVRWSPDGRQLAVLSDEVLELRDGVTLRKVWSVDSGNAPDATCLSWSPDSRVIAFGTQIGTRQFFATAKGQHIATLVILDEAEWLQIRSDGTHRGSRQSARRFLRVEQTESFHQTTRTASESSSP